VGTALRDREITRKVSRSFSEKICALKYQAGAAHTYPATAAKLPALRSAATRMAATLPLIRKRREERELRQSALRLGLIRIFPDPSRSNAHGFGPCCGSAAARSVVFPDRTMDRQPLLGSSPYRGSPHYEKSIHEHIS
jgi:hypothetical protein